jgi:hypothetical protein
MKSTKLETLATAAFLCLCLAAVGYLFFIVFIRSQF